MHVNDALNNMLMVKVNNAIINNLKGLLYSLTRRNDKSEFQYDKVAPMIWSLLNSISEVVSLKPRTICSVGHLVSSLITTLLTNELYKCAQLRTNL